MTWMPWLRRTEGEDGCVMRSKVLELKSLIKELLQVLEDRRVIDDERGAGSERGFLHIRFAGAGEGDYRNVRCARIFLKPGNGGAHLLRLRFEVHHDEERLFVFGLLDERRGIGNGLHAVTEILHAIDQLPAGQESFIQEERERLLHPGTDCGSAEEIAKNFSSARAGR